VPAPGLIELEDLFRESAGLYLKGNLADAEQIIQELLRRQPTHFGALQLLAAIASRTGRGEQAAELFGQAIALKPDSADAYNNRGIVLRDLGRYREALDDHDRAIALKPDAADGYSNRGAVLRNLGHPHDALASYDRAIALNPGFALAHYNRGNALRDLLRPEDAVSSYDNTIALRPDHAEAHANRGNALRDLKRFEEALASFDRAMELKPASAEIHNNRANTLGDLDRHAEALAEYDRAIECNPDFTEAHNNRGTRLEHLDRPEDALSSYDHAIALRPDFAEAHNNRGNALARLGRFAEALTSYNLAITLKRDYAEAWCNRGSTLAALGEFSDALSNFDRATNLDPGHADADNNRANVLRDLGGHEEALSNYHRAIALKPDFAGARWNLSLCQLAMGDFDNGWKNYEWRWQSELVRARRDLPGERWLGEVPIENKTILVHAEQGLGDSLQFCRYVPMLAERARVVLEVPRPLRRLLTSLDRVAEVVASGEQLPRFDTWIPMASLPLAFHTTLETIPVAFPYLHADPARVNAWKRRLAALPGRKIGLVWAGSPRTGQPAANAVDRRRSIALRNYAPLASIPGLCLISLQKGDAAEQARTPPEEMILHDWTSELDDFADTAALVEALDLVISVDTSVVHLAGALGKPVWVLNRFDQCWRWLRDRTDSPWYPSARLFRQPTPGDWASVIGDVAEALRAGQ
jgi:tetratricopeptide (TPR) repeat protein